MKFRIQSSGTLPYILRCSMEKLNMEIETLHHVNSFAVDVEVMELDREDALQFLHNAIMYLMRTNDWGITYITEHAINTLDNAFCEVSRTQVCSE